MSVGFKETSITLIELPKGISEEVPFVVDDCSLAFHLGFRNKILWWILEDVRAHYEVIRIPKKSGGVRIIHNPDPVLKLLLRRILIKILGPLQQHLGPHVTAYRKGVSARNGVLQHVASCPICDEAAPGKTQPKHECPKRGLYIHMDLKDFFPSTSAAWIRNYLKEQVHYNHQVAGYLANLLTVRDIPNPKWNTRKKNDTDTPEFFAGVPQGSPASGAICNLVADMRLDKPILKYIQTLNRRYNLTGEWVWKYSRYSDDLTFTCGINIPEVEREQIIEDLRRIIHRSGYKVNEKKTRIAHGYYRRALLGMVINEKPNYAKEEYLRLRAITYNCKREGFETQFIRAGQLNDGAMRTWLRGKINWVQQIHSKKGDKLLTVYQEAVELHPESASNAGAN